MLGAAALGNVELAAPAGGRAVEAWVDSQLQGLSVKRGYAPASAFVLSRGQVAAVVRRVAIARARTQSQALSQGGTHVRAAGYTTTILTTPGLVSYWKLGDSGAVARDWKGPNPGDYTGNVTPALPGLLKNDPDGAARFGGTFADAVDVGNDGSLQVAQGSLEAWVNINNGTSVGGYLFNKSTAYQLYVTTGGLVARGSATIMTSNGPSVNDGRTHYVVMTFQPGVTDGTVLYVDGVAVATGTIDNPASQAHDLLLASGLTGVMDEAALYNTVLTPAQIAQHYSVGIGAIGQFASQRQAVTRDVDRGKTRTYAPTQTQGPVLQSAVSRTRALTQTQQLSSGAQLTEIDLAQGEQSQLTHEGRRTWKAVQDQALGGSRQAITHRVGQGQAAALAVTFNIITLAYTQGQTRPTRLRDLVRSQHADQAGTARLARRLAATKALASASTPTVEAHIGSHYVVQAPSPVWVLGNPGRERPVAQAQATRRVYPITGGKLTSRLTLARSATTVEPSVLLTTGVSGPVKITTTVGS